jgi:hypothetical protein
VHQDEDGMVVIRGRLAPEVGAVVIQALTAAREALHQRRRDRARDAAASRDSAAEVYPFDTSAETSPPPLEHQQADALALVAETALHQGLDPGAVHEEGYQVERAADGELTFRRPDGSPLPHVPPAAAVPVDPCEMLKAQHDAEGLHIGAQTGTPGWLGERLNLGYAIDVLHPLAARF